MADRIVLFLTSSFPYPPGEQFIETEINYWSGLPGTKVAIMPNSPSGESRPVPDDVEVILKIKKNSHLYKAFFAIKAFFSLLLWKELHWLKLSKCLNKRTIFFAYRMVYSTMISKYKLKVALDVCEKVDTIYCYWNSSSSYAACLLKRQGKARVVASRAHGFDLYQERNADSYMPLKRQFCEDFDKIYSVSKEGKDYLARVYGFNPRKLEVSRLGVALPKIMGEGSFDEVVRICSASFCVPVKRIEKIVDAIEFLSKNCPKQRFEWKHFGGGPLEQSLQAYAQKRLGVCKNVRFEFAGMVSNSDILHYYQTKPVDVFVNTSESEGVPVSIMEAMSFGIPSVAPSVGGIPELVCDESGALLDVECDPEDIANAVLRLSADNKLQYRLSARKKVEDSYSADKNYRNFVSSVLSL